MSSIFFIVSLLVIISLPCSLVALVVYKIKIRNLANKGDALYKESEIYSTYISRKKISKWIAILSIPACIICFMVATNFAEEERLAEVNETVNKMNESDRNIYDIKYKELAIKKGNDLSAKEDAVKFVQRNKENIARIENMNEKDKARYQEKFNEFSKNLKEFDARDKAIMDIDEEDRKAKQELQKKYDDQKKYEEWIAWQQAEKEKAEKEALQKKYDDQSKYEEWMAWQQTEKEKAEKEALQKKYDDQAKYEEWIAWQQAEKEKAEKEELQKKYDDQAKYEEWIAWQQAEKEKAEAERNKYLPINTTTLYSAYKENAARANRDYSGKYVRIVGSVISEIESEGDWVSTGMYRRENYSYEDYYFEDSSLETFIHAYPKTDDAKKAVYNLNKYQQVVIYGEITKVGEFMGYSVVVDRFEW